MTGRFGGVALALLLATPGLARQHASAAPLPVEIARQLARELVDGKYDAAFARFDEPLRKSFGRGELERVLALRRERGAPARELAVLHQRSDGTVATITVRVKWTRGVSTEIEATVGADGRIAQLQIWDDDDPLYAYQTKASLRPPFRGTWTAGDAVGDGARQRPANPHLRFAFDWLIRDDAGRTFKSDGKRNTDYYAYGKEALAPAAGTVVLVVDGVPDNPAPGVVDDYNPAGNQVVIDLGRGEYAMLMHLQPGSIRVRKGQRVAPGQLVGKVGSSGRCTEPNLQFQLADGARLAEARSLPATFTRVLVDGEQAARAMPIYGTRLAPAEHWDPHGKMREQDED